MKTTIKLKDGEIFEVVSWTVTKTVGKNDFLGFVYIDNEGQKNYVTMLLSSLDFVKETETIKTI